MIFRMELLVGFLLRARFCILFYFLYFQISGQPNILYYSSVVFEQVGFESRGAALASLGLGLVKVCPVSRAYLSLGLT